MLFRSGVLDVVYNPLRTALILEARERGIRCAGGLAMLVAQAKYSAEQFAGHPIPDGRIDEIEHSLRRELSNLVLIGMPGSGKTTLGRACSTASRPSRRRSFSASCAPADGSSTPCRVQSISSR